jgi:hypothetical protein
LAASTKRLPTEGSMIAGSASTLLEAAARLDVADVAPEPASPPPASSPPASDGPWNQFPVTSP